MANFTERMIMETFVKLLEERTFDKITVKDIISELGISRNTFYYHFEDLYDLAKKAANIEFEKMYSLDYSNIDYKEHLNNLTHLASHSKKQIYHIINTLDRKALESYLTQISEKIIINYINQNIPDSKADALTRDLVIKCYSCALVGVLMRWIDDGMISDEDFIYKAAEIFTRSISSALQ